MVKALSVLLYCFPSKKNKQKYKRSCQLAKILRENPDLYQTDISDNELRIIYRAVANDEKHKQLPPNRLSSHSIYTNILCRTRKWLQSNWDRGTNESLTRQEKICILNEFGYKTK